MMRKIYEKTTKWWDNYIRKGLYSEKIIWWGNYVINRIYLKRNNIKLIINFGKTIPKPKHRFFYIKKQSDKLFTKT